MNTNLVLLATLSGLYGLPVFVSVISCIHRTNKTEPLFRRLIHI